jgi:hypothetical protein
MKIVVFWDVVPYNLADSWQKSVKVQEIFQWRVIYSSNTDFRFPQSLQTDGQIILIILF